MWKFGRICWDWRLYWLFYGKHCNYFTALSLSLSNILRGFVPINDRQLTLIHYPSSIWTFKRMGMGITSMHLSPLPLPLKPGAAANCLHVIGLILPVFPMLIKSRQGKLQSIIIFLLSFMRFACGLKPVASSECFISLLFQCKTPPHEYPIWCFWNPPLPLFLSLQVLMSHMLKCSLGVIPPGFIGETTILALMSLPCAQHQPLMAL